MLVNVLMANGSLTASDLELQITTPLEYDGEPILLPHAKLVAILNAARGDEVTIDAMVRDFGRQEEAKKRYLAGKG